MEEKNAMLKAVLFTVGWFSQRENLVVLMLSPERVFLLYHC